MAAIEPIQKIEAWPLSVAIWLHEHVEGPGKPPRRFYSTTLQRCYKTDDGYGYSDSLNKDDLLLGAKLLDQAHSAILRIEAADFAKRKGA